MMSQRAFAGSAALLFAVSAAVSIIWCDAMASMGRMAMPGGWTMSMAWMRMPGQSWPGAAATYLGMWSVMMVAMMLPALVPMLSRYRRAIAHAGAIRIGTLTVIVGVGYFLVWTLIGLATFPLGVVLTGLEMRSPALVRAVPIVVAAIVLVAGALQFSTWKARQLACCRHSPGRGCTPQAGARGGLVAAALRHGLHLGLRCSYCCAGLTAILFVIGVMDLRAMAGVTTAITVERLAPAGARTARAIGIVIVAAGLLLLARATLIQ
jgi:predicted metal-binding membrane protein